MHPPFRIDFNRVIALHAILAGAIHRRAREEEFDPVFAVNRAFILPLLRRQHLFVADDEGEIKILTVAKALKDGARRFLRHPRKMKRAGNRRHIRPHRLIDLAIKRQRAVTLDHIVLRHAEVRADDRRMRRGNGTRNATRQRGSRGYFAEHS